MVQLAAHLAEDMAAEGIEGKTLTLKLKTSGFEVRTRSQTLPSYCSAAGELAPSLLRLLAAELPIEIRLMGVRMANLRKKGGTVRGAGIADFFRKAATGGGSHGATPTGTPAGTPGKAAANDASHGGGSGDGAHAADPAAAAAAAAVATDLAMARQAAGAPVSGAPQSPGHSGWSGGAPAFSGGVVGQFAGAPSSSAPLSPGRSAWSGAPAFSGGFANDTDDDAFSWHDGDGGCWGAFGGAAQGDLPSDDGGGEFPGFDCFSAAGGGRQAASHGRDPNTVPFVTPPASPQRDGCAVPVPRLRDPCAPLTGVGAPLFGALRGSSAAQCSAHIAEPPEPSFAPSAQGYSGAQPPPRSATVARDRAAAAAAAAAGGGGKRPLATDTWQCLACTFAGNPPLTLRCEVCETPKLGPLSAPPARNSALHAGNGAAGSGSSAARSNGGHQPKRRRAAAADGQRTLNTILYGVSARKGR